MKKENAYMTVEAALLFPVVTGAIFFVIYMMLFQYDRCLLEQDTGAMALWGSLVQAPDTETLEERVQERVSGLYKEKYMMWRFTALDASLDKNKFSAEGAGAVFFPFGGLNFWGGGNVWSAQAAYSYSRLAPVTFIRTCHKFQNSHAASRATIHQSLGVLKMHTNPQESGFGALLSRDFVQKSTKHLAVPQSQVLGLSQ